MGAVVADSDPAVRRALRLLLEHELTIEAVREAATAEGLLRHVRHRCPRIVVVDWNLATTEPNGLVPDLRRMCPDLRILALGVRSEVREAALALGADSFVAKGDGPDQVIGALRALGASMPTNRGTCAASEWGSDRSSERCDPHHGEGNP
jgi:DNA-binding NarL/FixJ family response regulator